MSLKVTAEELEQHAVFADSVANQLIDRHMKLAGRMADLLSSGWAGAGADACQAAWDEWNEGFRLMIQGLTEEAEALQLASDAYRDTDTGAATRVDDAGKQL
ncbi:type VII secretion protein [Mycolicibacterium sp. (ex Dasyatis americana)]|nr:type VII secretion protein [Mycolicibacterium sp. (ex Dasyatis americana)]